MKRPALFTALLVMAAGAAVGQERKVVDPVDLEKATGAPVLNTKAIGIQFAEMCVRNGILHSPLAYPPSPAKHAHFMQKLNG